MVADSVLSIALILAGPFAWTGHTSKSDYQSEVKRDECLNYTSLTSKGSGGNPTLEGYASDRLKDIYKEWHAHLVNPLQRHMKVEIFAAIFPWDEPLWRRYFPSAHLVNITELPPLNKTGCARHLWKVVHANDVKKEPKVPMEIPQRYITSCYYQYGHLIQAYDFVEKFEKQRGKQFDYLFRARHDVYFRDKDLMNPMWFSSLPKKMILTPRYEFDPIFDMSKFHLKKMFINDQFVFGRREDVANMFTFYNNNTFARPWILSFRALGPSVEAQLKAYLSVKEITIKLVPLQYRRLSFDEAPDFGVKKNTKWPEIPCIVKKACL